MVAVVVKYDSKKTAAHTQEQEEIIIQVDISDNFLHRIARIYEFKYDMTNLPIQNITEQDILVFGRGFELY